MADKDLVFKVSVDTEGGKSLKDLKTEFNEVSKELGKAKVGSDEYLKSLQRLGSLKDQIGDLRAEIAGLTPEGKVQAFQNVASGLASGFQAATGAAALFGVQTGDVEKQLLKVQAVMAFTEGIKGITGLKDAFTVLNNVIKSNPIVATISAVAALTTAIIAFNSSSNDAVEIQKELNAALKDQSDAFTEREKQLKQFLVLARASGESEQQLLKREIELQAQREKGLQNQIELLANVAYNEAQGTEQNIKNYAKLKELSDQRDDAILQQAEAQFKIEKLIRDEQKKTADEAIKNKQLELKQKAELEANHAKYIQGLIDAAKAQQEANNEAKIQSRSDEQDSITVELDAMAENDKKRKEDGLKYDADVRAQQLQGEKDLAMAKETLYQNSWAAAKQFSDAYFNSQLARAKGNQKEEEKIRKKQFEVDKAFSISRAIIDGVRSVQAALTIAPPAGYVLAAANAILAVANIAKIASTQYNPGSASSASGSDVGNAAPSPQQTGPIVTNAPVIRQGGTNLGPNGENQSRVYVVESDITEKQARVARLKEQSTI